jgi:hypothetical protein
MAAAAYRWPLAPPPKELPCPLKKPPRENPPKEPPLLGAGALKMRLCETAGGETPGGAEFENLPLAAAGGPETRGGADWENLPLAAGGLKVLPSGIRGAWNLLPGCLAG